MIRFIIILIFFSLTSCKQKPAEFNLINGSWNIEKIENNGDNLLNRSLDPSKSNFYVAPYFHIFLDQKTFLIEVDAYNEVYFKADFEIKKKGKEIVMDVNDSNNSKLIGRYTVKIDTLKPGIGDKNETYRIHLQSTNNTYIMARKTVVKSFLKTR